MTEVFINTTGKYAELSLEYSEFCYGGAKYHTPLHYYLSLHAQSPKVQARLARYKNPSYIRNMINSNNIALNPYWKADRAGILERIIRHRLETSETFRELLMSTINSTDIIMCYEHDSFLGMDENQEGMNEYGKMLKKVRDERYEEYENEICQALRQEL